MEKFASINQLINQLDKDIEYLEYEKIIQTKKREELVRKYCQDGVVHESKYEKCFFIKLGKGGEWEADSIASNKIRIGWGNVPISMIDNRNWDSIEGIINSDIEDKAAAKRDLNALINILNSYENTVFITFSAGKMYWCTPTSGPIYEDSISKYKKCNGWSSVSLKGSSLERELYINRLPGHITKVQRFSGTLCEVKEVNEIKRIINGEKSQVLIDVEVSESILVNSLKNSIENLHWKDLELLVSLIFERCGLQRCSLVGGSTKSIDIEYTNAITNEMVAVQVKSVATIDEFKKYCEYISNNKHLAKGYFIFHTSALNVNPPRNIEIWDGLKLAHMTLKSGLIDWITTKL